MASDEKELRVCEYNVENLFISMDYHDGQDLETMTESRWKEVALAQLQRRQKPLAKAWGVARAVLDIDPDVLMLVEVGGQESLENLNTHFLGGQFTPYFVEGNSERGIDLGFLVKKELSWSVEVRTNRDLPVDVRTYEGGYSARFSRDVAEMRLHDANGLRLILLLVHLKSKISTDQDFRGRNLRTAEAMALAEHYRKLRSEHPEVPIVLGGDFNANLASLELESLRHTDLSDFHDLLDTPEQDRVSLVHFDYAGTAYPEVLDYLLVSPHLQDRISRSGSFTYRYKSFYELPLELPTTPTARYLMPSDHYPVVLSISLPVNESA